MSLKEYRIILKHVRSLPSGSKSTALPLVKSKFREGASLKNEEEIKLRIANAHAYVKLIQSVKEVSYLRSLDSGEKLSARDKIRASAARVGLGVPKFFNDDAVDAKDLKTSEVSHANH